MCITCYIYSPLNDMTFHLTKHTNWKEILLSFIMLVFVENWIKERTKEKKALQRYKVKVHLNSLKQIVFD